MSDRYDFESIEEKWQKRWSEQNEFEAQSDSTRTKYYVLEMLPYPSGALHMGHIRNYSLGDSIARFRKMQGFNVIHPIGWDAFGLPAENAAIQNQIPAEQWTRRNINRMREQMQRMGYSYDWTREIATCDPDYYRWNQWFFGQMFKRGLAYKKKGLVNWCDKCQTVLANEQVSNGLCWRDQSLVGQRELEQWYLKTTAYADELLDSLDDLPGWPEKVVNMQRNWIGKSRGARVRFELADGDGIDVFTTRIDTIYGATFMVLAPEHPRVYEWCRQDGKDGEWVGKVEQMRLQERSLRTDEAGEKRGVFTGRFARNPFNAEQVPIWVANFVLMEYGTGAIMAVPAHDERDFEFARKYDLPIRPVIRAEGEATADPGKAFTAEGIVFDSGPFSGLTSQEAQSKMSDFARGEGFGQATVSYRLKDWGISRQRYWGTPIPIINCEECGPVLVPEDQLPVVLPPIEAVQLGGSPLSRLTEFVEVECPSCRGSARRETDTMDTFVDSSWYFFRYLDPQNGVFPYSRDAADYWLPVDLYIGGVEHAVMHLIYTRFWSKMMRDLGLFGSDEPVTSLFTQGMVIKDSAKMSKSLGNVVIPDEIVARYGADTLRLFIQFCAPPDGELDWNDQGLEGCYRFLNRYWRLVRDYATDSQTVPPPVVENTTDRGRALLRKMHQTIRKVTQDLERFHQNTAIAAIMEFLNSLYEYVDREQPDPGIMREALTSISLLLSPFAPHLAAEASHMLGREADQWPVFDEELVREDQVEIVVQVNGRVRARFLAPIGVSQEETEQLALADERIQNHVAGKTIRRVIVVPEKLVNIVVGQ